MVASALVPVVSHLFIMLLQMTLALPFLRGGLAENPSVVTATLILWTAVAVCAIGVWLSRTRSVSLPGIARVREWLDRFPPRQLVPFVAGFALLAVFDIQIQWLASRAFGVPIEWTALAARIPLVYFSFAIPTLGNFGTREIAWSHCFAGFGTLEALTAYALWTNVIFLIMHALIGLLFFGRALELLREVRKARRAGAALPRPLLHDAIDP